MKNADAEIQEILNQVRPAVQAQIGDVGEYAAVVYKSQVVAGMNYDVKVHISGEHYIHVRIYKPLPHTGLPPQLSSLVPGKSRDDHF